MTPNEVAAELRAAGVVDAALTRCEPLAGGTASRVAALSRPGGSPELVIKVNEPEAVRAEAAFLRTYADCSLLPRLRYEDPSHRFLVMDFVPGVKLRYGVDRVDVKEAMQTLVRGLIGRYVPAGGDDEGGQRWCDALAHRIAERHEYLAPLVSEADRRLVER